MNQQCSHRFVRMAVLSFGKFYFNLRDLEKKNMLDPICIKKAKPGDNVIPKTIIRFCKGDPILITGDVGGNIDVYRINSNF